MHAPLPIQPPHVRVPAAAGIPVDRGIFMECVQGVRLLEAPLDCESRRDAARLVFRRLVLDPLFSGIPESIFHADPLAGNLMVQTQKRAPLTPDFYRSGLPTRTLAAHFEGTIRKGLCICKIRAMLDPEAREAPRALTKKRSKEKT